MACNCSEKSVLFKTDKLHFDWGIAAAALAGLLAGAPLFRAGLPAIADAPVHLLRTVEYKAALSGGWPVRWASHLAYGYGYPLFVFSPPLPYLLAIGFGLIGFSLLDAVKIVALLALIGGAIGAYLWLRDAISPEAGLIAAFAFAFAPLRLREAYLLGGNYPQLLALSLFPLLFWGLRRSVFNSNSHAVGTVGLCLGICLLSHLFQGFVALAVALAYVLCISWSAKGRSIKALLGLALGLGIGSFIWLPALLEQRWVRTNPIYYFQRSPFSGRFLDLREMLTLPSQIPASVANPYLPLTLNGVFVVVAVIGVGGIVYSLWHCWQTKLAAESVFFGLALLGSCFLASNFSQPVWKAVPYLAVAQYPWRWLGLACACLPWFAGTSWLWLQNSLQARPRITALILAGLLLLSITINGPFLNPLRPYLAQGSSIADVYAYEKLSGAVGTTTLGEYLPQWATDPLDQSHYAEALSAGQLTTPLSSDSCQCSGTLLSLQPSAVEYDLRAAKDGWLRLAWLYFPGWEATLDGISATLEVEPGSGFIRLWLPAGTHRLHLAFTETPVRLAGDWLSPLALAVALGCFFIERKSSRDRHIQALHITSVLYICGLTLALFTLRLACPGLLENALAKLAPPAVLKKAQTGPSGTLAGSAVVAAYQAPVQAAAGQKLPVSLYWQAQAKVDGDYATFLHLDTPAGDQTVASSDNWPPGDARTQEDMPTWSWPQDRLVRDEHNLQLPADLRPGIYHLRVGLYAQATGQRSAAVGEGAGDGYLELAQLRISAANPPKPGDIGHRLHIGIGGVTLLGYSLLPEQPHPGDTLLLKLYWQRSGNAGNGRVFVHLADQSGQPFSQDDSPFADGYYAPPDWLPGEIVLDEHSLTLPAGIASGQYRLLVGVYEPQNGQRWPVSDTAAKDNAVELAWFSW